MSVECKLRIGNGAPSRGSIAIKTANSGKKFLKFVNTSTNVLCEFDPATEVKSRFIDRGKLTFNFANKTPPLVVFVEGSTLQKLNTLLKKLRSDASVTTKVKTAKEVARVTQEKLVISSIEKMPVVFPASLKQLSITGISHLKLSHRLRHLQNLPNLRHLDLSSNSLTEIPQVCHNLALHTLKLSKNKISAYEFTATETNGPATQSQSSTGSRQPFKELTKKGSLLSKNVSQTTRRIDNLSIVPSGGSTLANSLQHLDLSENLIKQWDCSIVNVLNLVQLNLKSNKLKCVPGYISRLEKLETLYLQKNLIKEIAKEALMKNGYNRKFRELMLEENFCFQNSAAQNTTLYNQKFRKIPRLEELAFYGQITKLQKTKLRRRTPNQILKLVDSHATLNKLFANADLFWTCHKCSKLQYGFSRAKTKTTTYVAAADFTTSLVGGIHERFLKVSSYQCC